ncbi:uncharacterized protein SPSK_06660 [Sporothrix schenckii 1099-18]|nr:uncharacterized protein SPSK_06660 [Sporothrix schenckii 1099-18]KJR89104.1 hypothetical protein SPSK_06660 [Sporothrix schenckii 1099-18]
MAVKIATAHNSQMCQTSTCRTVTISFLVGAALLICATGLFVYCCKRGQRKVKNKVKSGVMGLLTRSNKPTVEAVESDEEQLQPQPFVPPPGPVEQPQWPPKKKTTQLQPPTYYQQPYSQPYDAPYEMPYYPDYHQQQQRQWQVQQHELKYQQKRGIKQHGRFETIPEGPAERHARLTRLASTVVSSV